MRIIYIHKDKFQRRPPVISAVMILNDLGHKVTVVTEEMSDYWDGVFKVRGMDYLTIPSDYGQKGLRGSISKIRSYYKFRRNTKSLVEKCKRKGEQPVLWIEGAQTIVALGTFIKEYRYILQIQELHTNSKLQIHSIGKVINTAAAVFMPEYNRTVLYKVWFHLEKRPYVLPNKPYFLPEKKELEEAEVKYGEIFSDLKGKKIILYQGVIDGVRNLDNYIIAAKQLGDDYVFCLLGPGRGDSVEKLSAHWENVYHVDFIPAPYYMAITAKAYIGIVSYVPNTLNNVYCAPNKMFEYGAYGVPMVGNDIPGLKLIDIKKAGITREDTDVDSILDSYKTIIADHDEYSRNARLLYESTDNKETIRKVLEKIEH